MVGTNTPSPEDENDAEPSAWHLFRPDDDVDEDMDEEEGELLYAEMLAMREKLQAGFDDDDADEDTMIDMPSLRLHPNAETALKTELANLRQIANYKKTSGEDVRQERYTITIIQKLLLKKPVEKAELITLVSQSDNFDENVFNRAWQIVSGLNKNNI